MITLRVVVIIYSGAAPAPARFLTQKRCFGNCVYGWWRTSFFARRAFSQERALAKPAAGNGPWAGIACVLILPPGVHNPQRDIVKYDCAFLQGGPEMRHWVSVKHAARV
jgi:hypothetical protein